MTTLYRIRRKQLIVLIVSLLLASSFYFIPLPDREHQQPIQDEQAQERLPSPTPDQPRLLDSTLGPASLAGRESAVAPSALVETSDTNKLSSPAEVLPPKQAPVTPHQQAGAASTSEAAPAPSTVEHLSTRDFSIPSSPLQNRILPAIQDNHF